MSRYVVVDAVTEFGPDVQCSEVISGLEAAEARARLWAEHGPVKIFKLTEISYYRKRKEVP